MQHDFKNVSELSKHMKSMGRSKEHHSHHIAIAGADLTMSEHDCLPSRTTGKHHEIQFGPQPGGLVPSNPFASLAQEGYLHAHPEKLGKKKLAEFDAETKGKKLPKHVKK